MNRKKQVLFLTLYYLDDISLGNACQVNKKFYREICNHIWLQRLKQTYGNLIGEFPDKVKAKSYQEQYILLKGLESLKTLKTFNIFTSNPLRDLTLLDIYQLKTVNLSYLCKLPRGIGQLENLQELYVDNNQLIEILQPSNFLRYLRIKRVVVI